MELKQTTTIFAGLKGWVQFLFFLIAYICIVNNLKLLKLEVDYIIKIIAYSSLLPLTVGLLGTVGLLLNNSILISAINSIQYVFIDNSLIGDFSIRNKMLTSEPAWAAMQITTLFLPAIYYLRAVSKNYIGFNILMGVCLLNLLFTGSSYILIWLICIIGLFLINRSFSTSEKVNKNSSKFLYYLFILIFLSFIVTVFFDTIFSYQLLKVTTLLEGGLESEGSTAIRFYTPVIGINIFLDKVCLFGIGLNQFGLHLPFYAPDWYQSVGEGIDFVSMDSEYTATPRNMYVKVVLELGLLGIILFFIPFYKLMLTAKSNLSNNLKTYIKFSSIGILVAWLNYDSFIEMYIIFILAFFSYIHSNTSRTLVK